jgi:hydrogenase expression/formation protein HypC
MCLGVPGQVIQWLSREATFGEAIVEFAGVQRRVHMACVPDAAIGDYVVVHAGIAICRIDESAAERTLEELQGLLLPCDRVTEEPSP